MIPCNDSINKKMAIYRNDSIHKKIAIYRNATIDNIHDKCLLSAPKHSNITNKYEEKPNDRNRHLWMLELISIASILILSSLFVILGYTRVGSQQHFRIGREESFQPVLLMLLLHHCPRIQTRAPQIRPFISNSPFSPRNSGRIRCAI